MIYLLYHSNNCHWAFADCYSLWWSTRLRTYCLNSLDNISSLWNTTKDNVTTVEPASLGSCDEKLTSICSRSGISHWQTEWFVSKFEVFIFETSSIDRLSSSSISSCEISSLDHEVGNDSMERTSCVFECSAVVFDVSLAKSDKVLNSFRNSGSEHIYDDVSWCCTSNINRECNLVCDFFLNKSESTLSKPQKAIAIKRAKRAALNIKIIHVKDIRYFYK